MEGLALLYIAAIAVAAPISGWCYLLFPELGSISHDMLTRPWGKWAGQPARLVITPALGAAIGTLVTRELPYIIWPFCSSLAVPVSCRFAQVEYRSRNFSRHAAARSGYEELVLSCLDSDWRYRLG